MELKLIAILGVLVLATTAATIGSSVSQAKAQSDEINIIWPLTWLGVNVGTGSGSTLGSVPLGGIHIGGGSGLGQILAGHETQQADKVLTGELSQLGSNFGTGTGLLGGDALLGHIAIPVLGSGATLGTSAGAGGSSDSGANGGSGENSIVLPGSQVLIAGGGHGGLSATAGGPGGSSGGTTLINGQNGSDGSSFGGGIGGAGGGGFP